MDEWRKVRLGDVCHTNTDSYSKKDKWDFVNYLDTGNITANCIDEIQHIDILNEKLPSRAKRKVKYNSIIYSTVRPNQRHYGIIKSQPENFLVSTGFAVIDVDSNNVDADFLYFLLSSDYVTEKLHAIAEQSVSAYPSIKASDIEDLEISLPPLTVQRKISSLLMSIEDKIAQNVAINKNLEKQVQAIFKANFIENDNVSTLPQIPLADLCKVVTKGTTPTTLGKPFTDRGINFIRAESILDRHTIDTTKFAFIDYETHAMLKRSIILHGDILFTIAGTLGRFALIDDSMLPANTNQAVAIIRADEKKVAPEYVYSFFIGN